MEGGPQAPVHRDSQGPETDGGDEGALSPPPHNPRRFTFIEETLQHDSDMSTPPTCSAAGLQQSQLPSPVSAHHSGLEAHWSYLSSHPIGWLFVDLRAHLVIDQS